MLSPMAGEHSIGESIPYYKSREVCDLHTSRGVTIANHSHMPRGIDPPIGHQESHQLTKLMNGTKVSTYLQDTELEPTGLSILKKQLQKGLNPECYD